MTLPPTPRDLIDRWAVASQLRARRNAMVASTALTRRRAEAAEVEEFLASLATPALPTPVVEAEASVARG